MANTSTAWKTDRGPRPANEDSCLVLTRDDLGGAADGLLVVADGMGGRASGATASALAVEAVRRTFTSGASAAGDLGRLLSAGLKAANTDVVREAGTRPELQGMGTTCVAAAIKDGRLFVAHVGDSRGYLLRDGRLLRLTQDHSIVAEKVRSGEMTEDEARRSRFRNVITKAIGLEADLEPDVSTVDLRPGDVLILCSDGLSGPVREPEIAEIVGSSTTAEEACDRLVKTALKNGGSDNVTVAIAAYRRVVVPTAVGPVAREGIGRKFVRILVPSILGIAIGLSLGLYAERIPLLKRLHPVKPPFVAGPSEPQLLSLSYGIPASLLYTPVQGSTLALFQGHLYVLDTEGRLMKLDQSGRVIEAAVADKLLEKRVKMLSATRAVDRQGNLFISDPANKQILNCAADGGLLRAIGTEQLVGPQALTVDPAGNIYVIDGGRLKVIRPKPVDVEPRPKDNAPTNPE